MKPQLIFSLYTPENPFIKKAPAREISVPSVAGRLQILPGHAPLVSLLEAGVLNYRLINSSKSESAAVGWGYIEVTEEEVIVLAESLQTKEALDREQAKKDLEHTERRLLKPDLDPGERRALEKSRQRLQAAVELQSFS